MRKILIIIIGYVFITNYSYADCTANFMSDPDSIFGQSFSCDDGSTMTYQRNSVFGDTITNDSTGETYSGSFLSNIGDEYDSIFGRSFDSSSNSLTLDRNSIFGDTISLD